MGSEISARRFEPFFSTKGDRGTGLGLATYARGIPHLELIISDVLLPRQSGPELIRQLEAQGFTGSCLLVSGYVADSVIVDRATGERIPLLQKPFSASDLNAAVARALRDTRLAAGTRGSA